MLQYSVVFYVFTKSEKQRQENKGYGERRESMLGGTSGGMDGGMEGWTEGWRDGWMDGGREGEREEREGITLGEHWIHYAMI